VVHRDARPPQQDQQAPVAAATPLGRQLTESAAQPNIVGTTRPVAVGLRCQADQPARPLNRGLTRGEEVRSWRTRDWSLFGVGVDRRIKLEFHGARITSDDGPLPCGELDDASGLMAVAITPLFDPDWLSHLQATAITIYVTNRGTPRAGAEDGGPREPSHDHALCVTAPAMRGAWMRLNGWCQTNGLGGRS
jgi:hypothetical protein